MNQIKIPLWDNKFIIIDWKRKQLRIFETVYPNGVKRNNCLALLEY